MSVLLELTDITIPKVGKRKSIKERLIDSIQKEIEDIRGRKDTEKVTLQNGKIEDRFWRDNPNNKSELILYVKLKKKIWNFGKSKFGKNGEKLQPQYWIVENSINSIVEKLTSIYKELKGLEEDNDVFVDVDKQF